MAFRSLFDWMNPEKPVGRDGPNRKDDVERVESLLDHAGYLNIDKTVLPSGKYGARTDKAMRAFQRDNGLKVDGLANPGGPTIRRLVDNTFRDDPKAPPPRPVIAAVGSGTRSRAGPGGQLSKVRTPSPPRATLLGHESGRPPPPAAPDVGDRPARVRTPASRRPTLLSPDFGVATPSAAPNVGDRQTPPESVGRSARKTGGSAFGDDDPVLAGGSGRERPGDGGSAKPAASGHGKPPGVGGVAPNLPPPTNDRVVPGDLYRILDYDPDGSSELSEGFSSLYDGAIGWLGSRAARRATDLEYKGQLKGDNEADAGRHALWHYKMTKAISAEAAKRFGDAHERSGSDTEGSLLMDLYNNEIGRRLALDPKNSNRRDEDVILEAIRNGRLQTRPFIVPYSGLTRRPGSSSR